MTDSAGADGGPDGGRAAGGRGHPGGPNGSGPDAGRIAAAGAAAAEESARVASRLATPSLGITRAGLPIRVPKAHLVPGSFPAEHSAEQAAPARSAEEIRDRLGAYQRGVRRGRQPD